MEKDKKLQNLLYKRAQNGPKLRAFVQALMYILHVFGYRGEGGDSGTFGEA